MKHTFLFLLLILLLGLTACSKPADRTLMNYEQSLSHADSLVQCGAVDSARAVRLISGLRREYNQIKELSDGRHVRLKPVSGYERFFLGSVFCDYVQHFRCYAVQPYPFQERT